MNVKISKSILPKNSLLFNSKIDYKDSYTASCLNTNKTISSTLIAKAFFNSAPNWVHFLMKIRNKLVSMVDLKTGETNNQLSDFKFVVGEKIGLFTVFSMNENEEILGENDKHLDFKISLFKSENPISKKTFNLTITTIVVYNNWFGKVYFKIVKPMHRLIVPVMLKNMIIHLQQH